MASESIKELGREIVGPREASIQIQEMMLLTYAEINTRAHHEGLLPIEPMEMYYRYAEQEDTEELAIAWGWKQNWSSVGAKKRRSSK